ncbi:MAG: hypothetical protein Q9182_003685 [Xanthomendoza sp. 2 TL-2023]
MYTSSVEYRRTKGIPTNWDRSELSFGILIFDALADKAEQRQGYAPGSWSQVAFDRTSPHGRVVGIDVIPAQPPAGVSTIQGNFLSAAVQDEVKTYLRANRDSRHNQLLSSCEQDYQVGTEDERYPDTRNYFEQEKQSVVLVPELHHTVEDGIRASISMNDPHKGWMVDVVLSDMSAPWEQTEGFWKRSLSDPYYRMMNTSGISFRDHAGSMDLCDAALRFAFDTLRSGGHFVCKFYQGAEDKVFEARLRMLFKKVYRGEVFLDALSLLRVQSLGTVPGPLYPKNS